MSYTSSNTIRTVATREIAVAVRNKGIIFSLIITLILAIGGIGVASYFNNREDDAPTLAVVGISAKQFNQVQDALGENVEKLAVADATGRDAAEAAVKEDIDAALIKTDEGYELLSDGQPKSSVQATVAAVTSTLTQNEALDKLGINPQEFGEAMGAANVKTTDISEDPVEEQMGAIVTVMLGMMLMTFFIMLFAGNIGGRITEEKSSRVVEIILASVRPLDFLAGKLIGNTIVGLVATAVIVLASVVALSISGLADGFEFDMSVLPMILVSFILGMLFFGSLYAAAGSMVSRTEDLQSTQMPILLFVFGMIYAPAFGFNALDSTIMQVLGWLPPFSLAVAPLQYVAGHMSLSAVLAAYGLCVVAVIAVLALVARIYRNAILHNGKKMSWIGALK
ncbi:ABC transporter permease [Corynebacterium urealyticum]|uniref:ABC transporter permease n=1 Tax=Corynebacterium urealyticum TaxID=43771 RepID=UPI0011E77865|nr:ABC transporter permease [Corynebacterium urealyticum]TYR16479.1 ABC transporter permease [Corynebacterium urealyticum]TYR17430.1 ABC transporter permease [Corynebacterium urealyticum]TYT21552.1 ABC transporter permease [Corynebacterium urealyticum]